MRIISFSKKWDKLNQIEFTTFRFPRGDKDWYQSEIVQVFFKSRSPQRENLGVAEIISKESRLGAQDDAEAQADGFIDCQDMEQWMIKTYGERKTWKPMNKLTLRWVRKCEAL